MVVHGKPAPCRWGTRGRVIFTRLLFTLVALPMACSYGGSLPAASGCKATTNGKDLLFLDILLFSIPFILRCSETWSLQKLLPGAFGKRELEFVADNWQSEGSVTLMIDCDPSSSLWCEWGKFVGRCAWGPGRGIPGVWRGYFLLCKVTFSLSKIFAAWDYVEKGSMEIIEAKESYSMVCSHLPKTVVDQSLKEMSFNCSQSFMSLLSGYQNNAGSTSGSWGVGLSLPEGTKRATGSRFVPQSMCAKQAPLDLVALISCINTEPV